MYINIAKMFTYEIFIFSSVYLFWNVSKSMYFYCWSISRYSFVQCAVSNLLSLLIYYSLIIYIIYRGWTKLWKHLVKCVFEKRLILINEICRWHQHFCQLTSPTQCPMCAAQFSHRALFCEVFFCIMLELTDLENS